ncbi:MAG TPA: tail fiber protein [Thermoanaerobaculia bacterium]|jgi:microcystin-dependent protein|nr:tail fiber protein [Thermoanaerobaculia bacterium]
MDTVIGEVVLFPFNFNPRGWIACDGTLHSATKDPDKETLAHLLGGRFSAGDYTEFRLPAYDDPVPGMRHCVAVYGFWPDPSYSSRPRCIGEVGRFFLKSDFVAGDWQRCGAPVPALPQADCLVAKTGERALPESYSGAIRLVDVNVAGSEHDGWFPCDGRLMKIDTTESRVLLSLIGSTYGGDYTRGNFALPKLDAPAGFRYYICARGIYPERPR